MMQLYIDLRFNYRKRGSASCVRYFRWERERERERERDTEKDGSDVTIVALKLAMSLHFPLPKIRTNGNEFTLSLAKNSHFLFLPSHFPSLPSLMVTIVALKFAMSSHFRCQKTCPSWSGISQMARAARRVIENLRQNFIDQILPSPTLFFPSKNWIKLIPKTIGNRKRDCAWGGSWW